jgi:hypothetical protein
MSIIFFIFIVMENLRRLKGQGRRKGVISPPTSGSKLKWCLFESSHRARVPLQPGTVVPCGPA